MIEDQDDSFNIPTKIKKDKADQASRAVPLEDLAFDDKENVITQDKRRYDIFRFTAIGCILQNIQY